MKVGSETEIGKEQEDGKLREKENMPTSNLYNY